MWLLNTICFTHFGRLGFFDPMMSARPQVGSSDVLYELLFPMFRLWERLQQDRAGRVQLVSVLES